MIKSPCTREALSFLSPRISDRADVVQSQGGNCVAVITVVVDEMRQEWKGMVENVTDAIIIVLLVRIVVSVGS